MSQGRRTMRTRVRMCPKTESEDYFVETRDVVMAETMPLERLEAEITQLAGNLAAAECRWLMLIAEFDRRAGYEQWGCRTCSHWLNWHCGLDLRAARERV